MPRTRSSPSPHRTGLVGEAAAEEELVREGYRILARRFRAPGGEADFVAEQNGDLVFVEVKCRGSLGAGRPREAVTFTKQKRLMAAARNYCSGAPTDERPIRFDVVEVLLVFDEVAYVVIIPHAFTPFDHDH